MNLGPFQPVEVIKILLVFFMAGYFTGKWERLRDLREKRFLPRWLHWLEVPRLAHVAPVICAVVCSLALFFLLKDLGPALVTGFLFLVMFALARGRSGLAIAGIVLLVAGVTIGYRLGQPKTVVDRISMWLSPWDNDVHGGDQLAHSLWAFSTGGVWGSGPGWGDPAMIPAGHTDLVLPAIGEEWGFTGVSPPLCSSRFWCSDAPDRARGGDEYGMFLALGLGSLIALEMLLISGGVLGAIPLSGVVSPFLSSGNTAMLANFLIFAIILSISSQAPRSDIGKPFTLPARRVGFALAACALALVARALTTRRSRSGIPGARREGYRRGRREAKRAQSATQFAGARDPSRQIFTIAMASCSPPAIGTSWSGAGRITTSWASRSTGSARRSTIVITRSAR